MLIEPNDHILFTGDSITDCGWKEGGLGKGYVNMIASRLSVDYPDYKLNFSNRGISGNRMADLLERADADLLEIQPQPTLVSILIGINDVWGKFDSKKESPLADFYDNYSKLLARVKRALTSRIIILEPFALPVDPVTAEWRDDLDPKIQAVRQVAADCDAIYIPLDGIFAGACSRARAPFWVVDGVHPTQAGHQLIADAWLDAVHKMRPKRSAV